MKIGLNKVKIDQKNVHEAKSWGPNGQGKSGTLWPVGIKIGEEWFNGALFSEEQLAEFNALPEKKDVPLVFYEDKYGDKITIKFKMPRKEDLLEFRLDNMEKFAKVVFEMFPDIKQRFMNS